MERDFWTGQWRGFNAVYSVGRGGLIHIHVVFVMEKDFWTGH
jgi:hypothetical protein